MLKLRDERSQREANSGLLRSYSEALDALLAEGETSGDFRELAEAVEKLAQKTLAETLKRVAESKDFSP